MFLGCPEPVPNHAKNCVEMGLAMIHAIREFDEDRHESVNMRVSATAFMISNESEVQRSEIKKMLKRAFLHLIESIQQV